MLSDRTREEAGQQYVYDNFIEWGPRSILKLMSADGELVSPWVRRGGMRGELCAGTRIGVKRS